MPSLKEAQGTPRAPGRPRGSAGEVVSRSRHLGIHHFAFLRCGFVGIDARAAFERYLEWGETTSDLRHIAHRHAEILKHVLDAGRRLDLTLAPELKIASLLDLLRSSTVPVPIVVLPTLDAWMVDEGMDPSIWSEADAISEYRAAHGIDNLDAIDAAEGLADVARARVGALNHLQTLLAVRPTSGDAIDAWFARPVVVRLRNVGVVTLNDLVSFINVYGHRWHDQVKGFGARRAPQVVAWLRAQHEALRLDIRASVDEPKRAREVRLGTHADETHQFALVLAPRFALVPLELLALPAALLGTEGVYRSHMANTLEASDDLQAITRWLSRYAERASTARSYRKEIERFVLWCTTVQKKPVSSASALDCQAFRAFLSAVPADWIHPVPVERTDPAWRPFRGQPAPASQKQALIIVQTLFEGLRDAGYLVANPMRSVMKGFRLPKSQLDIKRSFTEAEWRHVLRCIAEGAAAPSSAKQLRLRCILELLVSSGIRLDELAHARRGDLRLEALPDLDATWVLSVTGKRDKQRDVPLGHDIIELIHAHGAQFAAQDTAAVDAASLDPASLPLIRGIDASVVQWARHDNDDADGRAAPVARTPQGGAALSAAGISAVVKRFFVRAAKSATDAGLDVGRFERASTHWMRHTFVRQALVDGVPVEVVAELVGHASVSTTSLYSSQELARKIGAIHAMKRRTAAAP